MSKPIVVYCPDCAGDWALDAPAGDDLVEVACECGLSFAVDAAGAIAPIVGRRAGPPAPVEGSPTTNGPAALAALIRVVLPAIRPR